MRLYLNATSHLVVNRVEARAMWSRHKLDEMEVARLGSTEQKVLQKSGDDLRIDWGGVSRSLIRPTNLLMRHRCACRYPIGIWTRDGKQRGFQARSVVGGLFIKMLEDKQRWQRWASQAK